MNGDRPAPQSLVPGSGAAGPSAKVLGLVYDIAVIAIAGSALFFMFAGSDAGMDAAGGLGAVASFWLGYASLRRRLIALGAGVVRYSRLWVGMTVVSALSLINGKWEPLVLFAVVGVAMTLLYALGGWLGLRGRGSRETRE
jgi:hypothetical protein